jgi:short subunit fatty acids transporter
LVLTLSEKRSEAKQLANMFMEALEKIIPNIKFESKFLKINSILVNESLFSLIIEVVYLIMNKKPKIIISETDDEMTKKMKETQRKIQEIKTKGKKMNEQETSFEDMFAALLYEFPQYKLEDLFQLNIYTFYFMFKYIGKIANYEVSKIAAGNGLAKKHKYFIEK